MFTLINVKIVCSESDKAEKHGLGRLKLWRFCFCPDMHLASSLHMHEDSSFVFPLLIGLILLIYWVFGGCLTHVDKRTVHLRHITSITLERKRHSLARLLGVVCS